MTTTRPAPSSVPRAKPANVQHAIDVVSKACLIAGSRGFLDQTIAQFERRGLLAAVRNHGTAALFSWLVEMFSFQGVSDRVAEGYIKTHGSVAWREIAAGLRKKPPCPRLTNYWTFDRCGYDKGSGCCTEPEHVEACPLPRHRLRNGRLNQTAYGLYFFLRDIAGNDLVRWIDRRLEATVDVGPVGQAEALIDPLRNVFGISDKILTMSLSTLLLGAGPLKPSWPAVGAQMIAIDTLVHNFLHRTGILTRFGIEHSYGPRCYAQGGCCEVLRLVSTAIDARRFNPAFPRNFPRYVQNALWRFCAADGFGVCNGNMIDDRQPCRNVACRLYDLCDHITLRPSVEA